MAGLGVWGGRQEKTPSRFSSNPCLWFVASSLSSLFLCLGFPFFISSCPSLSPPSLSFSLLSHLVTLPGWPCLQVSVSFSLPRLFHFSDSSLYQHLCLSVSSCPGPSVRLSPSACAWVSLCPSVSPPICLVVCASPSKGTHSLPKAPSSPRSAKASPGSGGGEEVQSCSFWKPQ